MESGTDCSDSERFSAVTVIVSSSFDAAAVSAANTRNDTTIAATPAPARQFFDIPILFSQRKRNQSRNRLRRTVAALIILRGQPLLPLHLGVDRFPGGPATPLSKIVSGRTCFIVKNGLRRVQP